jgi:hypothetical protein
MTNSDRRRFMALSRLTLAFDSQIGGNELGAFGSTSPLALQEPLERGAIVER